MISVKPTVPPWSPVKPSAVVFAVMVLVALMEALPPASMSPPEMVTVGVLCRMALATAASTSSSSSSASSGTVVSVEVTVDLASMLRLPVALTAPSEISTSAVEKPMANAMFTELKLKLLSAMVRVDSARSVMFTPESDALALFISMRLKARKTVERGA